jgi:anti-sigma factor RsiW
MYMADHLGEAELDTYCRGGADDTSVARIERHLLDCPDCARRVYERVRAMVREQRARQEC